MKEHHPSGGYGVVPDDYWENFWQVRYWDGQTGESSYCVSAIQGRKNAERIRDQLNRDNK